MPSILIIGGNDRSLWANRGDLIGELLAEGWEVEAALPPPGPVHYEPLHRIQIHRLALERAGLNPLRDLRYIRAVRELVARRQPDVVFSYNPKPVALGGVALRRLPDTRFVALITGRGGLERRPGAKGALTYHALGFLYGRALRRPDALLFQNEDDRAFFQRRWGLGWVPAVDVIPGSGINLERFPPVPPPPGPPRYLIISRLLIDKGVREFVQAARLVAREFPECRFRLVGGHEPELPHAIPTAELERWRREGLVEFTGRVDDVRPHLAWCSVLCHPSYAEGTPRAVLEALSTGRPVITTDAPGCRQTIEPGRCGFLVTPADAWALAETMALFAREREQVAAMGAAALERAREVYDVRKVNRQIIRHLRPEQVRVG